jgi:hypothetical protein
VWLTLPPTPADGAKSMRTPPPAERVLPTPSRLSEPVVTPPAMPTPEPKIDPRAEFLNALQLRDTAERERQTARALRRWLEADFAAAEAHVRKLLPGEQQPVVVTEMARALATRDPARALEWGRTLPDSHLQQLALLTALEAWAVKDPVAAGRHVQEMAAGPAQMAAASRVARVITASNPSQAVEWVQSLSNPLARELAVVSVASTWAQRQPAEAAKWAAELPTSETRTQALGATLSSWLLEDPAAAKKFVTSLNAESQPRAAAVLAPLLVHTNPRQALEWARTLPHPAARDGAVEAAYARWREQAPADAEAWLKQSNLPAATKSKLQKSGSR